MIVVVNNEHSTTATIGEHHIVVSTQSLLPPIFSGFLDPTTSVGDLIVRDSSNTINRLPLGSAGKVLVSDGVNVSWGSVSASGEVSVLSIGVEAPLSTTGGQTPTLSIDLSGYMAELLYDPYGKKTNCFDLSNQTGSLDCGVFT